jgi:hypothetical protein
MRCPNCGNENPDDYTFCDECGARLTAQEGETAPGEAANPTGSSGPAGPAGAPQEAATYVPASAVAEAGTGSSAGDGGASAGGGAPMNGAAGSGAGSSSEMTAMAGGVCPNCGATTVPGEAFCNECGAELTPAAAAGAPSGDEIITGTMTSGGLPPGPTEGPGGRSREVPVSEDTMSPGGAGGPGAQADAGQPSMPGVVSIDSSGNGSAMPAGPTQIPAVSQAPGGAAERSDAGGDTTAWANSALQQLEEAQQAMARGDWVAYGTSMSSLKAFLQSVAGGTASEGAAGSAPGAAAPVSAPQPPSSPVAEATAASTPSEAAPPPLPASPQPQAAEESAPAAAEYVGSGSAMARLVMISTGAEMPLPQQEEITVGREDPSSGIFPDIDLTPYGGEDGGVSRRHARMLHIGNDYFIEDLQSTNYTKLDGQRLPARVREKLEDGARIDFGRVAVIFRKS